ADVNGVNALRREQFAMIFVCLRPAFGLLGGVFDASFVGVAERDYFEARNHHDVVHDLLRSGAGPDETKRDTPIRAVVVVESRFRATAHPKCQARSGAGRRAALDKFPAIDTFWHFFSFE